MTDAIDQDDPFEYYSRIADELERIAETAMLHPAMDHELSKRLRAFAQQIRRDSGIDRPALLLN